MNGEDIAQSDYSSGEKRAQTREPQGQVGGFRAAEFIANRYADWSVPRDAVQQAAAQATSELQGWIARFARAGST